MPTIKRCIGYGDKHYRVDGELRTNIEDIDLTEAEFDFEWEFGNQTYRPQYEELIKYLNEKNIALGLTILTQRDALELKISELEKRVSDLESSVPKPESLDKVEDNNLEKLKTWNSIKKLCDFTTNVNYKGGYCGEEWGKSEKEKIKSFIETIFEKTEWSYTGGELAKYYIKLYPKLYRSEDAISRAISKAYQEGLLDKYENRFITRAKRKKVW